MQTPDSLTPDKQAVRRAFGQAAARYDRYAELQRRVGAALFDALAPWAGPAQRVVDLGSGTGFFLPLLARCFPDATLIALDLAEPMLRTGRTRQADALFLCGDAESLPLADGAVDAVFSNLALQWCGQLRRALIELARVLRPGGVAAFSLFGPATLDELRRAWRAVDDYPRVGEFVRPDAVRTALAQAGLQCLALDEDLMQIGYASVRELMGELKGLGAGNAAGGRPRHLTGKSALARMERAYRAQRSDGAIIASYQVLRVVARRP